jgi:hypothetical protein
MIPTLADEAVGVGRTRCAVCTTSIGSDGPNVDRASGGGEKLAAGH